MTQNEILDEIRAEIQRDGGQVGDRYAVCYFENGRVSHLQWDVDGRLTAQPWGPQMLTVRPEDL